MPRLRRLGAPVSRQPLGFPRGCLGVLRWRGCATWRTELPKRAACSSRCRWSASNSRSSSHAALCRSSYPRNRIARIQGTSLSGFFRRSLPAARRRIPRTTTFLGATKGIHNPPRRQTAGGPCPQRQRRAPIQPRATPWEVVRRTDQGLKARPNRERVETISPSWVAPSALRGFPDLHTWGVAPGWHRPGFWPSGIPACPEARPTRIPSSHPPRYPRAAARMHPPGKVDPSLPGRAGRRYS